MEEYIPLEDLDASLNEDFNEELNERLNEELDIGFNVPSNNDEFILPNAPIEAITLPNLKYFKKQAGIELREDYKRKLDEYLKKNYNFDYKKFLDVFINEDGDVFIKARRSNDWSQLTNNSNEIRNKEFIDINNLKIIKSDDGRKNRTTNKNLIDIIKDPNYRVENIIDRTHPVEDTINDVSKIIRDSGLEPGIILNELYKNRQIIKDPEIAKILITLKQHVDEYQKLLNEERDVSTSKTLKPEEKEQRLKELKDLIDKVENDVLEIVNGSLSREIDKVLDIPLLSKIKNILGREGLTIAAIAGIIGTIISTIFSIIFGVKAFNSSPGPGPGPGPGPNPKPDPNIYKKIKEAIASTLNKIVEILKKIAAWALATLPAVIGPIVSWLFERAADIAKYVAENTFIIIMLLLGLGFKFIIDYLEGRKKR